MPWRSRPEDCPATAGSRLGGDFATLAMTIKLVAYISLIHYYNISLLMANKLYLFVFLTIFVLTITIVSGVGGYYLGINNFSFTGVTNIKPTVIPTVTPLNPDTKPLQSIPVMGKTYIISYDSLKLLTSLPEKITTQANASIAVEGRVNKILPSGWELRDKNKTKTMSLQLSPNEMSMATVSAKIGQPNQTIPYDIGKIKLNDWLIAMIDKNLFNNETRRLRILIDLTR
ncbi:MAG: hypothetical protein UT63_C0049G0005 [Candidatus Gottesmanbacteria bacterium GW2011_GWC2_39_8]|uniref:Uncharacterized protein n=1 Tax=Candidatus Gottesmanbacteria bacterium GW2011_GWC2_39_8 TaxID=1618450 RepID=A0A0G0Q4B7_9BACT|nr:MAG: hypothetical protein UT63_C0049G0005 [Candidatus Gottesmanbacteria bacterium GW2011_GWC2_39_8]